MEYGKPLAGVPSTIGSQARTDYFQKKALIEIRKEQFFSQLADVTAMPKNMGKKIKQYIYVPMLNDNNINDQGIDAAGAAITASQYFVTLPNLVQPYASGAAATSGAAAINAIQAGVATVAGSVVTSTKRSLVATTAALSASVLSAVPGSLSRQGSGNLYGSSKDIGTIAGKLPALSESGGRVNRVGYKRKDLEGTFEKPPQNRKIQTMNQKTKHRPRLKSRKRLLRLQKLRLQRLITKPSTSACWLLSRPMAKTSPLAMWMTLSRLCRWARTTTRRWRASNPV